MNGPCDCLLTLAVPEGLGDELLEYLLDQEDLVTGFTVQDAEGLGAGAELHTALERVRGRARRQLVLVPMQEQAAHALIGRLRERFTSPEIAWWTTPLSGFGRLG